MKKIITTLLVLILLSSLVLAQGGPKEPRTINAPVDEPVAVTTRNVGEDTQIQTEEQTQGNQVVPRNVSATRAEMAQTQNQIEVKNKNQLQSNGATAHTNMEMTQNGEQVQVKLSNGKNAEVKVMPDAASEKAMEQLRMKVCNADNGCSIELKEVKDGEQVRAAYEVQVQKQAKVLGLFKTKMQVQAQVDAENGEVFQTKKPWWAFLASESEE